MLKRHDLCVLVGAVIVVFGGALFLNLFGNEPLWVEWLLGPLVVGVGLVTAIIGVALRCYAADAMAEEAAVNSATVPRPTR